MSDVDDLVTWLRAQVDDDERLLDAYEQHMSEAAARAGSYVLVVPSGWHPGEPFDVDRQRAGVAARRRILDLHAEPHECPDWDRILGETCTGYYGDEGCPTMRLTGLEYADRPGYRDEWRPA